MDRYDSPSFGPETPQFNPQLQLNALSIQSLSGSSPDVLHGSPPIPNSPNARQNLPPVSLSQESLQSSSDALSHSPTNTTSVEYTRRRPASVARINKQSQLSRISALKTFSFNLNFIISFFIFLLCMFMGFICILYGFGQITQLQLSNYWCQKKDLDTIYKHSYKYGLNQGTNDGCWKSKQFTVDESALFDESRRYETAPDVNFWNVIRCIVWLLYAVWFILIGIGISIVHIIDLYNICNKHARSTKKQHIDKIVHSVQAQFELHTLESNGNTKGTAVVSGNNEDTIHQRSSFHRCCPCCCCLPRSNILLEWIGNKYWQYIEWYRDHFGEDTRNWFIFLVFREIIEILFQTLALYNYNGLNLFNPNQLVLAYGKSAIILFASLLGINAISVGILWILYVLNHRLCQGLFFKQLIFVIDTVFEGFYALFPIAVISARTGFNLEVAVGVLQTTNLTGFLGTFVPVSYLTFKCMFVLMKSRNQLTRQVKTKIQQKRLQKINKAMGMNEDIVIISNQNTQLPIAKRHAAATVDSQQEGTILATLGSNPMTQTAQSSNYNYNHKDSIAVNSNTIPHISGILSTVLKGSTNSSYSDRESSHTQSKTRTTKSRTISGSSGEELSVGSISTMSTTSSSRTTRKMLDDSRMTTIDEGGEDLQAKRVLILTKFAVCLVGVVFICLGSLMIILNSNHFNEANDMCTNPDQNTLESHPELHFWQDCLFKTFPFESTDENENKNEIHCNCRKAKIDLSEYSGLVPSNVTVMIESMLSNWDMLELLYITDGQARFSVNLTSKSHYSAKYLKILHLSAVTINTITEDIDSWSNLEYLHCTRAHWQSWPENFEKINKLSYLHLWDVKYTDALPPNLCDMTNLRLLSIQQTPFSAISITQIPDCVAENLQMLQSVSFYFAKVNNLPPNLFRNANIREFAFIDTNVSLESLMTANPDVGGYSETFTWDFDNATFYQTLLNNEDYWNWDFGWNNDGETVYYLTESRICEQYWDYYGYRQYIPIKLLQFLNETKACENVCSQDSWQILVCSPFMHQNGVCDESCNSAECGWDGGDCNQLCFYNGTDSLLTSGAENNNGTCEIYSMFENGECNKECNTTYCSFDAGDCIELQLTNATYCNLQVINEAEAANESLASVNDSLCRTDWVGDGWCDQNCRSSEHCLYDSTDCECEENSCSEIYSFFSVVSSASVGDPTTVNNEEMCAFWDYLDALEENGQYSTLEDYSAALAQYRAENRTCDWVFNTLDINNSTEIDINEFIFATYDTFEISKIKAAQINCTSCLESQYGI